MNLQDYLHNYILNIGDITDEERDELIKYSSNVIKSFDPLYNAIEKIKSDDSKMKLIIDFYDRISKEKN